MQIESDFIETDLNFICLSEVWANKHNFDSFNFQNFRLFASFYRKSHIHGGVGIWANSQLLITPLDLDRFCCEIDIEVCGLIWNIDNIKVVIITCYRSPIGDFSNFLINMHSMLDFIFNYKYYVILIGDFNVHFERPDGRCRNLMSLLTSFNMFNIVDVPTRGDAVLDNIFVNFSDAVSNVYPSLVSDHSYITMICDLLLYVNKKSSTIKQSKRSFSDNSVQKFVTSLQNVPWPNFSEFSSADAAFDVFFNLFMYHFNYHFPMKYVTVHNTLKNKAWVSNTVKDSSRKLRDLYQLQAKYPDLSEHYKSMKKVHQNLVIQTKRSYYTQRIFNSKAPGKEAWSVISDFKNKRVKENPNINLIENETEINNPSEIAEKFNNFFMEEPHNIISKISGAPPLIPVHRPVYSSMCAYPFTEIEFLDVINKLKTKLSSGPDDIPCGLLRQVAPFITKPLTELVNLSFDTGTFPSALKIACVTPVHKRNSEQDKSNYRPISQTSSLSKLYEYAMLTRLLNHLKKNNIIIDEQHGFREHRSTITAVHSFINSVVQALDKGLLPAGVFCDLSRAFDCVNHRDLIDKLSKYGIRGVVSEWFVSYLTGRVQYVKITFKTGNCVRNAFSSCLPVTIGVPQGSILGPILFLLFINDIVLFMRHTLFLYADDTSSIVIGGNPMEVQAEANRLLADLGQWFSCNSLVLNLSKTNYMYFHSTSFSTNIVNNVTHKNSSIERTTSMRFLGMTLDENLNWKVHCEDLIKKVNTSCYQLRNLKYVLCFSDLLQFYYSEIYSRITYGVVFWGSSVLAHDVFIAQKRVLRCLVNIKSYESCRSHFQRLAILPLPSIYIMELLCYIFNNQPTLLKHCDIHKYDTRAKNKYKEPLNRLEMTKRSPTSMGIKLFNLLPNKLKLINEVRLFKRQLRTLLLEHCIYSVEEFVSLMGNIVQ